jgi:putative N6-adenine-specific DNA methylase
MSLPPLTLLATVSFGLEAVVKRELLALGFEQVRAAEGKVEFAATAADIPRANLWLRSADRVLLKMGEATAVTFDELFEQTKALPWETWIPVDGQFNVQAKTVKSTLNSVRACQSIVKKAIAERLMAAYGVDWLAETGVAYTVQAALLKDVASLTIDTSGAGLHLRGYRDEAGAAPLRETLAAALVQLSFWNPERLLVDPMCGSGTILIEAALLARNMAPGLNRRFASEEWAAVPTAAWSEARRAARQAIRHEGTLQLRGYDSDPAAIEASQNNAANARVADDIVFAQKDVRDLWIDQQYGILISHLPYAERTADFSYLNEIYLAFDQTFKKKFGWSLYFLTADKQFPNYFKRANPDRVRKLYNGMVEVNYYQYYGEKPER